MKILINCLVLCILVAISTGTILSVEHSSPTVSRTQNAQKLQSKWTQRPFFKFDKFEYGFHFTDERKFLPSFEREPHENSVDSKKYLRPLHVTIHARNQTTMQPVMVYIDSFDLIQPLNDMASPGYLLEKDIVLVSVEYRTGANGFLSMRNNQIPGNAALLDIVLALKWIQRNIHEFGGDPARVTLFGQYKAAGLIHTLMLSELGKGLFQQVILQSGSALLRNFTTKHPVKYSREVGSVLNCPDIKNKMKLTQCLLEANEMDLNLAFNEIWEKYKGNIPFITIGGPSDVLNDTPPNIHRSGQFRIYPKIIGFVDQPSAWFFDFFDPNLNKSSFFSLDRFSKDAATMIQLATKLFGESPLEGLMPNASTLAQLENANPKVLEQTFNLVVTSILDWSNFYVKSAIYYTGYLNKTPKTYAYTFKYNGKRHTLPLHKTNLLNAAILLDDNRYLFDNEQDQLDSDDTKIAKLMVDLWTSFAETGKPYAEGIPEWPEVKVGSDKYLVIDDVVTQEQYYLIELQSAVKTFLEDGDNILLEKYLN